MDFRGDVVEGVLDEVSFTGAISRGNRSRILEESRRVIRHWTHGNKGTITYLVSDPLKNGRSFVQESSVVQN